MKNYYYQCFNCKSDYALADIEENLEYLCPVCISAEKNQPLKGVLEIVYDYDSIKVQISRDSFLRLEPGKFWNYPYLWPLEYDEQGLYNIGIENLQKLALNSNNISEIQIYNAYLKIFDDSRNPTLSYKDRASILIALKAFQLGINEISAASTGNAGSSLAGICARLGIKSHIFVPKNIPSSKRIQIQAFGANIYIVDGDYDEAFDLCLDISKKKNWYNRNTGYNPLTIEGKKSSVYDMFISLKGNLPDYIFVPVGDGVIISGIYKGLKELLKLGWIDKLPKLMAVQAEESDAMIRYLENGEFEFKPSRTVADSILASAPRNLYMAAEAVRATNGTGIRISDSEIIAAQKLLAQKFGILVEPAAAATLAGYLKIFHSPKHNYPNSILMLTGNGLKDVSSVESWIDKPSERTFNEWKNDFS